MSSPRISFARSSASCAFAASLIPPALPRPPVRTCALTTTGPRAPRPPDGPRRASSRADRRRQGSRPAGRAPCPGTRRGPRRAGGYRRGCGEHSPMRRRPAFSPSMLPRRGLLVSGGERRTAGAAPPAGPQRAELGWEERFPDSGPGMVFRAHSSPSPRTAGRRTSRSRTARPCPAGRAARRATFVLVRRDALRERLAGRGRAAGPDGDLPGLRRRGPVRPPLPARLAPGRAWRGTIGARGSLAAGLYVRLVYGPFVAVGEPPEGMQPGVLVDHRPRPPVEEVTSPRLGHEG